MTPHEIELAHALHGCTYVPACPQKRFARDMWLTAMHKPEQELTLRQRHYMEILAWTMRRQMPQSLVPDSKPLDLPPKRKPPKKTKQEAFLLMRP